MLSFHGDPLPVWLTLNMMFAESVFAYPHPRHCCLVKASKTRTPWTLVIDCSKYQGEGGVTKGLFPFFHLRTEVTSSSEIWYVPMSHSYSLTETLVACLFSKTWLIPDQVRSCNRPRHFESRLLSSAQEIVFPSQTRNPFHLKNWRTFFLDVI